MADFTEIITRIRVVLEVPLTQLGTTRLNFRNLLKILTRLLERYLDLFSSFETDFRLVRIPCSRQRALSRRVGFPG